MTNRNESLWLATGPASVRPALSGRVEVDVAIVGAGVTGVTAAMLLVEAGYRVALVDLDRIVAGETGHTTAHLTDAIDARYHTLRRDFGREGARFAADASRAAIEKIAAWAAKMAPDAGFSRCDGYLFTESEKDLDELHTEAEAAREAGVDAEFTTSVPLPFKASGAVQFRNQGQIHPRRYLLPLIEKIAETGSLIFEKTKIVSFEEGDRCTLATEDGSTIVAESVFVAANVPVNDRVTIHTKIYPYRTYAIAVPANPATGLFWDTADPYHYIRWQTIDGTSYLIVGGEDHRTGTEGDTDERYERLEEYARAHFGVSGARYRWSGQVIEPMDGLPYIGRNPRSERVFIATGYAGQGMTFGTVAGMLVSDLIIGRENPWATLFDPSRIKPIASAVDFVTENAGFPAHLVPDRLTRFDVDAESLDDVPAGEGRLVVVDGKKRAVFRSEKGELTILSPVCTHLGCDVRWNREASSWDCPCHGSRFGPGGNVINGPAVADLKKA
jgi:glycine/D-amino acid oxidase-like deaminating enzyme/nitrite reductase/ring-hydroxylating ferredoxin subunit